MLALRRGYPRHQKLAQRQGSGQLQHAHARGRGVGAHRQFTWRNCYTVTAVSSHGNRRQLFAVQRILYFSAQITGTNLNQRRYNSVLNLLAKITGRYQFKINIGRNGINADRQLRARYTHINGDGRRGWRNTDVITKAIGHTNFPKMAHCE